MKGEASDAIVRGLKAAGVDLVAICDVEIDRAKAMAAKFGANINAVGTGVQLVTNGVKVTEYRPSDTDKSVDIIVRFPEGRRSLDQLDELRIQTPSGYVPIGNFVKRVPAQRVGYINRVSGSRVMTVSANVADGVQSAVVQKEITDKLGTAGLGDGVSFKLKGEDEEKMVALIAQGPPSEEVGLDLQPYAMDPRLNPRPSDSVDLGNTIPVGAP